MISDKFSQIFWKHLCAYHEGTTYGMVLKHPNSSLRGQKCLYLLLRDLPRIHIWRYIMALCCDFVGFHSTSISQGREMTKRALSHVIFKIQRASISLFWVMAVLPLGCVLITWSWFLFFSLEWRAFSSESSWDLRWNTILCHNSWSVDLSVFLGLSLFPSPVPVKKKNVSFKKLFSLPFPPKFQACKRL